MQHLNIESRRKYENIHGSVHWWKRHRKEKTEAREIGYIQDEWKRGGNKEAIRTWYRTEGDQYFCEYTFLQLLLLES